MDPRTAKPVEGVLQATLIASDSTTTDAVSNALFVLGPEPGRELLDTMPDASALWVLDDAAKTVRDWQWPNRVTQQGTVLIET